jgi:hypothetical protein
MTKYVENMINEFPVQLGKKDMAKTPAGDNLFNLGTGAKLDTKRSEIFHTFVVKGLFLCKRARPDIQQAISVLCTRVKDPNQADWEKLMRAMKYLNGTRNDYLTLSADDLRVVKWYVDASFAVHPDFKSHTGAVMMLGKGAMQSIARKQTMKVQSSTEGELVTVDDAATMILWTKLFLEAQGYEVDKNIVYQDNKSAILLETNGKRSSGKRTRALNIRYFFITDQVEKGNAQIEHFGTDDMVVIFLQSHCKVKSSYDSGTIFLVAKRHKQGASDRRDIMDDVKNLKSKRSQTAAKSKEIVATVDHKSGSNNKWAKERSRASRRTTTKRSRRRGLDMMRMKTKITKIVRRARRVRRNTLMRSYWHQTASVNALFEDTQTIWQERISRINGW